MNDTSHLYHDDIREIFLEEAKEHLEAMEELFLKMERDPGNQKIIEGIFRLVHTLKGSGNSVGFENLGSLAHIMENLLAKIMHSKVVVTGEVIDVLLECNDHLVELHGKLREDPAVVVQWDEIKTKIEVIINEASSSKVIKLENRYLDGEGKGFGFFQDETSPAKPEDKSRTTASNPRVAAAMVSKDEMIRLSLVKIDDLLNSFGEQVILQSSLEHATKSLEKNRELITTTIRQLGKITYHLQQSAFSLRMVNLKALFTQMERTIRDTSKAVDKPCRFITKGVETELEKTIVDRLGGVITHLLRNAIDHGLEAPKTRILAGKDPVGTVKALAYREGGYFFLEISDDGGGIDNKKVWEKAIASGIVAPDTVLTEEETYNLLFASGFSTKSEATAVSGRGVGMDAVKEAIAEMKGDISIASAKGVGTTFTIKLSLSMAIFNGMLLKLNGHRYILQSGEIKEIYRFKDSDLRQLERGRYLLDRGQKTLTLFNLAHLIGEKTRKKADDRRRIALLVNKGGHEIALEVDDVVGQQRIVQKKLDSSLEALPWASGGAVLGDGGVALILNLDAILANC